MEQVLECRVCEEVFTVDGVKVPRLLHCGHTVCHSCLLRLKSCMSDQQFLLCPFDRQPTGIRDNSVYSLKKNFALIELLERLEQSNSEKTLMLERERLQSNQPCDEDEAHTAVLYCTVCATHLCEACDTATHSSKTLGKHRRVPLSEKPREKPRCPIHTAHVAEFTCTQEGCHNSLMCYLCKEYGKHSTHKVTPPPSAPVRSGMVPISCLLLYIVADTGGGGGREHQEVHHRGVTKDDAVYGKHERHRAPNRCASFLLSISIKIIALNYQFTSASFFRFDLIENSHSYLYISEIVIEELEGWAIEDARRRVRYHFEELRAVLAEQEKTAMAYVENETRGRLCALRQQQKDLTSTRSQVAGVCIQCESILDSEDWKLLSSSEKVKEVLATLEQQQQHYAQLGPDFLSPVSSIPIIFSRVRIWKFLRFLVIYRVQS